MTSGSAAMVAKGSEPDLDLFEIRWRVTRAAYRRMFHTWKLVGAAPEIFTFDDDPTLYDTIARACQMYCDGVEEMAREHNIHDRLDKALKRIR